MPRSIFWLSAIFLYSAIFLLKFAIPFPWVYFIGGVALGVYFFFIDRCLRAMVEQNDKFFGTASLTAKFNMIAHQQPILASFWAIGGYIPLAVYVLTSSGSVFGSGLVLGIGLRYFFHLMENLNRMDEVLEFYHFPAEVIKSPMLGKRLIVAYLWIFAVITAIALR